MGILDVFELVPQLRDLESLKISELNVESSERPFDKARRVMTPVSHCLATATVEDLHRTVMHELGRDQGFTWVLLYPNGRLSSATDVSGVRSLLTTA